MWFNVKEENICKYLQLMISFSNIKPDDSVRIDLLIRFFKIYYLFCNLLIIFIRDDSNGYYNYDIYLEGFIIEILSKLLKKNVIIKTYNGKRYIFGIKWKFKFWKF